MHDVKKLHSCEQVLVGQELKIAGLEEVVRVQEGIRINLVQQVDTQKLISGTLTVQLEETIEHYKGETKHFKKKFIKTAIIAVLEGALIILIIISK